ncbi:hypothetical protein N2152v2_007998 [Parachlorella kessleri]
MRRFCAASCYAASCTQGMQRWAGHSTAAGTAQFAAGVLGSKVAEGHFRRHNIDYSGVDSQAGALTLSSLGVGTYLGNADKATDDLVANAVIQSVAKGLNVIDTAANYRWGRAEQSVGQALLTLRMTGAAQREMLFVSTKAGYAAGKAPQGDLLLEPAMAAQHGTMPLLANDILGSLQAAGKIVASDVVSGHCMHPACLEASLERSLESLGLEAVDLFYVHNPAESQLRQLGKAAFMQRLKAAFEFCEAARQQGRIKAYGLATWACFRVAPQQQGEYLSLREVVRLAEEVGGRDHGFRYVQLPVNAKMREAWTEPWQEGGAAAGGLVPLVQAAQQLGIGVFSSGPLLEAQLLRSTALQSALEAVPQLQNIPGTAPKLLQLARSCPGLLCTLVGHKTPQNVEANLVVVRSSPLSRAEFVAAVEALSRVSAV